MSEIRRQARARRAALGLPLEEARPASAVVEACLAATGLAGRFLPTGDARLAGALAVLDAEARIVFQDESRPAAWQAFDAAHEFTHFWRHGGGTRSCTAEDLDPARTAEPATGARSKVEDDAPHRRREDEANMFAAELLLPGPLARRLFEEDGLSSGEIAEALGMPEGVVQRQLADAVLLPPPIEEAPVEATEASRAVTLDEFQSAAAQVACGPLLLGAGPGTGKTKTLVGRCQFLTQQQGIPATQILALTFSRKAAQEMRERLVAAGVGTERAGPWVGTFHSFGQEVLRRFGERIGLGGELKLLDTLDAVTLLENHLAELNLDALDNLYNPAIHLGGILGQIGRAKDELCPPARYASLCAQMRAPADAAVEAIRAQIRAAGSDRGLKGKMEDALKRQGQAAKAAEVARCYGVYERLMREGGFLDFGDLIARTVELLEGHPDVRATLQAEYPHVLADEYQDVNRACARLVKLLAGEEAEGLWAVGDHRQSIYQFQGASPANVAAFGQDYPTGRRLELGVNYRSRTPIVDLFGAASRGMEGGEAPGPTEPTPSPTEPTPGASAAPPETGGGRGPVPTSQAVLPSSPLRFGEGAEERGGGGWRAHRGTNESAPYPAVTYAVTPDDVGQARGIAQAIGEMKAGGWDFRQQAILCRSHAQAEALAGLLSAQDIPVLYLGALLERPEVKDLLCLLALVADPGGSALVRVAAFAEYAVPQADALALLTDMRRMETPLRDALRGADLHPGLGTLAAHLAELDTRENDPAALLRFYLFGLSRYLQHLTEGEPKPFARRGRTLAIHQLLGLAGDFDRRLVAPGTRPGPPHRVREFLAHLRRLQSSGQSPRGTVPAEAEGWDAVRLLTAHAAKGLEYPVVFLPNLGAGQFPTRGRSDGIPTPPGLADAAGEGLDEEQCLFFVALSRARDHLVLSRAETSGSDRAVAPSPLLTLIQPHLEARGIGETAWPAGRAPAGESDDLALTPAILPEYSSSALEMYLRCPRQFHYGQALKLTGAVSDGYPQFHACVRRTLGWLEDAREQGGMPMAEEIAARLEAFWAESGPVGHLHEAKYKESALGMLRAGGALGAETEQRASVRSLRATLSNCHVHVRPDAIRRDAADGTLIVARHLTGKPGDNDHTDKRLALYRRAACQTHPDTPVRVELRYLSDGTIRAVAPPEKKQEIKWEADRVAKYERAARGIQLGLFPARPESGDECQTCAYALICPL
jgi:DNA helicase-2/ATP-dependent DNA helicase PcrA